MSKVNYPPREEMENQLNFYKSSIEQLVNQKALFEDIKSWLEHREVKVPNYLLKDFLRQFEGFETEELETEKVIISPQGDAARIQEMEKGRIEEKDELKKEIQCPVCSATDLWKNGVLKGVQHYKCKECKKQFTPGAPLKEREITSTKHCPKCKEIKLISEFNKNSNESDGLQKVCKDCQKNYNVNIEDANELYVYLKQLQAKRDNEPITIKEVKAKHKQHSEVKYNVLLNYLAEEGHLSKGKNGNKNIYWLADFEETEESKNEIEKRVEENTTNSEENANIPVGASEKMARAQFKKLLESKKIDLFKLFAADYSIANILDWLMKWEIRVPYDILIEFKKEHKSDIHALEKMYKTGVTGLKESWEEIQHKNAIIYSPPINELSELFNVSDTYITINTVSKENFFRICKILDGHAIDFNMFVDSTENKFEILIAAEEDE